MGIADANNAGNVHGGTVLKLLDQVASNALPDQYSPSQLGYAFAFSNYNFPAAAAMSLILLAITLAIGLLIVFKSGLFSEETH